jgi:hypothetical protein
MTYNKIFLCGGVILLVDGFITCCGPSPSPGCEFGSAPHYRTPKEPSQAHSHNKTKRHKHTVDIKLLLERFVTSTKTSQRAETTSRGAKWHILP